MATVIGIVVLTEIHARIEVAGVTLVIAGVALHHEPPEPAAEQATPKNQSPEPAISLYE